MIRATLVTTMRVWRSKKLAVRACAWQVVCVVVEVAALRHLATRTACIGALRGCCPPLEATRWMMPSVT